MIFINKIFKAILVFTAASLTGWIYETLLGLAIYGIFENRGVLHLPLLPVYGVGAIIIYIPCRKISSAPVIFLAGAAISTVTELAASYITESIFNTRLWDYTSWPLHYEWRISLVSSIIFGSFSVFLMKTVIPSVDRFTGYVKKKTTAVIAVVLAAIISADIILCLI